MLSKFFAKMSDEQGQGLVEYALILVLVSVVCVVLLTAMGVSVQGVFTRVIAALTGPAA